MVNASVNPALQAFGEGLPSQALYLLFLLLPDGRAALFEPFGTEYPGIGVE